MVARFETRCAAGGRGVWPMDMRCAMQGELEVVRVDAAVVGRRGDGETGRRRIHNETRVVLERRHHRDAILIQEHVPGATERLSGLRGGMHRLCRLFLPRPRWDFPSRGSRRCWLGHSLWLARAAPEEVTTPAAIRGRCGGRLSRRGFVGRHRTGALALYPPGSISIDGGCVQARLQRNDGWFWLWS